MSQGVRRWFSLTILLNLLIAPQAGAATVELHAHLFMKDGMSWMFRGGFFEPLRAKSWKDRFSSQADPTTLRESGNAIVVAALYAHPLMCLRLRDCIRAQVADAEKLVRENPTWILAKSAPQAKAALARGKRVLILALEGASDILESDEDLREFVDRDGIAIVTPLHLTDDEFGGVAFLPGLKIMSSPIAWLEELFARHQENGVWTNPNGLTDRGRWLIQSLMAHHAWIDLSHSSDASQKEILPMLEGARLPLLYTHTMLRKFNGSERAISEGQLERVRASGGFVGVMPSEEMLEGTPARAPCDQGIYKLRTQYEELVKILGAASIGLGSDVNGGIPHLKPSAACPTRTALDTQGWWNMAQTQDVWAALKNLGAPVPADLSITVARFLEAWERVLPVTPPASSQPHPRSRAKAR